jgi:hypothetical protein
LDKDLEGLIDNDEEMDEMGYLRVLDKVRKDFVKQDKKVTFPFNLNHPLNTHRI